MFGNQLTSLMGIAFFLALAWTASADKKRINWNLLFFGLFFQMLFALFIFKVPVGTKVFLVLNDLINTIMQSSQAGTQFLFGPLATAPGQTGPGGESSLGFIFAIQALPAIIFFSSLMSVLYFYGIMPFIIKCFARIFSKFLRLSGAESLCAASNIFVGIESALTIRPHLDKMTRSELCTVLTCGMATVSSNILAVYIFSLQSEFSTIAGHLMSASFLSAPAALIVSKLLQPEVDSPVTKDLKVDICDVKHSNLLESIISGAQSGVKLIVGIAALLVAMLGLTSLADIALGYFGGIANSLLSINVEWSLINILGYLFLPFTYLLGVAPQDTFEISKLLGERIILTEVASYQSLGLLLAENSLHDKRSAIIATYALCGFAHIASLAIFIGGIGALAPKRIKDLSEIGLKSLFAATLACLLTACIAGIFATDKTLLF